MIIFVLKFFLLKYINDLQKKIRTRKGIIHIHSTYNNTLITLRTIQGEVINWSSARVCGFRGARKRTPFAAKIAIETVIRNGVKIGIQWVRIYISGPGSRREKAIRRVYEIGFRVVLIRDITSLSHNGCRPPKRRWIL